MVVGICSICKEHKENCYQRSTNTIACRDCESVRKLKQIIKRKSEGRCADCSKKKLDTGIYCEYHYIKRKLKNNQCKHLDVDWYYQRLESQNYKCPYTNLDIIIGINDSIDHIIPLSKGGLSNESNIVICDHHFNLMKLNHTLEDIYLRCKGFCDLYESTPSNMPSRSYLEKVLKIKKK